MRPWLAALLLAMMATHLSADIPRIKRQSRRGGGGGGYARPEVPVTRDYTGGPDYGTGPGVSWDDQPDQPQRPADRGDQGTKGDEYGHAKGGGGGRYDHGSDGAHGGQGDHGDHGVWRLEDAIPGTPESDYPTYSTVPKTSFDCKAQQYRAGYFADVEARCQVFHICQEDGRHDAFLCPIGTIFNQKYFVCDWWQNFDCNEAPNYYSLNGELYKETPQQQPQRGTLDGGAPAPRPGGGPADFGPRPQATPTAPAGPSDFGQDYDIPQRGYGGGRRRGNQAAASSLSRVYYDWND